MWIMHVNGEPIFKFTTITPQKSGLVNRLEIANNLSISYTEEGDTHVFFLDGYIIDLRWESIAIEMKYNWTSPYEAFVLREMGKETFAKIEQFMLDLRNQ